MKTRKSASLTQETVRELHRKGHLAVHTLPAVHEKYDRLDELSIIGNLREDDGIYPIISTTVLPPAQYSCGQHLFKEERCLFLLLNLENTVIKDCSGGDIYSYSGSKNKKGRFTYKAQYISFFQRVMERDGNIIRKTDKERLDILHSLQRVTYEVMKIRSSEGNYDVNESLLKIDLSSVIGMGAPLNRLKKNPEGLLNLLLTQQQVYADTGIFYSLYLYNNQSIPIDYLGRTFQPNTIYVANETVLLKKMVIHYPKELSTDSITARIFRKNLLAPFTQNDVVNIEQIKSFLLNSRASIYLMEHKQKILKELKSTNELLLKLLPLFDNDDEILQIHKEGRKGFKRYQYDEINQAKLESFIKTKVLSDEKISNDDRRVIYYKKGYNLQFRLHCYQTLLEKEKPVNLYNLSKDLARFLALHEKLPKAIVNDEQPFLYISRDKNAVKTFFDANRQGEMKSVMSLLQKRMDPNVKDILGQTALSVAAEQGKTACVEVLLKSKANVNHRDSGGTSTLPLAARCGHTKIVKLLFEHKAEIDRNEWCGLVEATEKGHLEIVKELLKHKADVNKIRPSDGRFALTQAIRYGRHSGNRSIEDLILANNPDVNLKEPNGLTALLLYASAEQGKYVKKVLELKADVSHPDEFGYTPSFWARHWNREDILKCLTEAKIEQEARESSDKPRIKDSNQFAVPSIKGIR